MDVGEDEGGVLLEDGDADLVDEYVDWAREEEDGDGGDGVVLGVLGLPVVVGVGVHVHLAEVGEHALDVVGCEQELEDVLVPPAHAC